MKTLEQSKQEMIDRILKDSSIVIESINSIKELISKQGSDSIHFEWNVRTLNSCCIELQEMNNYMLNEIQRYNTLIKNR